MIENAKIDETFLGFKDRGILTWSLCLGGDGWSQSFGSIASPRIGQIGGLLKGLGVLSWEQLAGLSVRVLRDMPTGDIKLVGKLMENSFVDVFGNFGRIDESGNLPF